MQDQLQTAFERFEQRSRAHLTEELAKLRLDVRGDMAVLKAELRQEFVTGLITQKADIMKWMFTFWIGQAAVTVGLILAIR